MKRAAKIIFLFLLFFFAFSCDELQLPKEIEIRKKTPELRMDAGIDGYELSDLFGDLKFEIEDAKVTILDCINRETLTYIIHMELFDGLISESETLKTIKEVVDRYNMESYPSLGGDILLWSSESIHIQVPSFSGTPLDGLKLKPLTARVYMSGENEAFLDTLDIELYMSQDPDNINEDIEDNPTDPDITPQIFSRSAPSNIIADAVFSDAELPVYLGDELPASDNEFELEFLDDLYVQFRVLLRNGERVYASWLDEDLPAFLELAIWFPCEFIAIEEAELSLPFGDWFFGGDDLFNRSSNDDDSLVQYLENAGLEIRLNTVPFPDSIIVVESPGALDEPIRNTITDKSIVVTIDKEHLGYPFKPEFRVEIPEGNVLSVPRVLELEEFAFKAELKIVVDVPEIPKIEIPKIEIPEGWKLF